MLATDIFHAIHYKRDMTAVKMTAVQHLFAVGIDDWIVIGAVQFVFDGLAHPWQRIGKHADHMGRAADGITILQPLAIRRRLTALQILAQPRRHLLLAGMRLDFE